MTTVAERNTAAAESVKKVEAERDGLPARQQVAEQAVERLHTEILTAERGGADATPLRQQRTDQEKFLDDLPQLRLAIERDLDLARAELRAATIATQADSYNALVEKQRALTTEIDEAITAIVDALKVKEAPAKRQEALHVTPYPTLSAIGVRWALQQVLVEWCEGGTGPLFSRRDWSTRRMSAAGDLFPIE